MRRLVSILVLALAGCGGQGAVGQGCYGGPQGTDCVSEAICSPEPDTMHTPPGAPNGTPMFCRLRCDGHADCPTGFTCQGVEGSVLSSCQPAPM